MCTLTFLPVSHHSFILGANRDESPQRPAARPPVQKEINGQQIMYPVDGQAGGTWIAASDHQRIACLLNGAFEPHTYNPPYRVSRGVMVLESFAYANTRAFIDQYSFDGIEPFTYVSFEWGNQHIDHILVTECRWDGQNTHVKSWHGTMPQIWSSASLYTKEAVQKRQKWFEEWLAEHRTYEVADILRFHHFGGEGDEMNDIRMNRHNLVRTLSITAVYATESDISMYYEDLLAHQTSNYQLPLASSSRINKK